MELSHVIIGPVVTEKAERLKTMHTYVLKVRQEATKIDVKNALRRFYDVEVASVRVLRTAPKVRIVGLTPKSKALDLSTFRTA